MIFFARMCLRGLAVTLVTVLASWMACPGRALAQSEEQQTAAARALFDEGRHLASEGHYEQAAERLRRALALRSSPAIHYNLGLALSHLGRLVEACEHLRRARRVAAGDRVGELASELLRQMEPRLARLTVRLEGATADVQVTLDGDAVDDALVGVAIPVDPGRHVVEAWRRGIRVARAEATIRGGAAAAVCLSVQASDSTLARPPPRQVAGRRHVEWLIVAAAFAVAGLVLDLAPSYARDDRVDTIDLLPIGLYATAGVGSAFYLARF